MKKFLLVITTTLFIASFVQAQITKGSVLLGGGISLGKGNSQSEATGLPANSGSQYNVYVSPAVGLAIKQNTVLGINLTYGHSKSKDNNSSGKQESNFYGGGFFVRRYIPLGKSFYLFGEAGLGYNQNKSSYETPNNNYIIKQDTKNTNIGLSLYPGIAYAVNRYFQLEASINNLVSLGYNKSIVSTVYSNSTGSNQSKNNNFSFNTNASAAAPLTVGFRFFIAK